MTAARAAAAGIILSAASMVARGGDVRQLDLTQDIINRNPDIPVGAAAILNVPKTLTIARQTRIHYDGPGNRPVIRYVGTTQQSPFLVSQNASLVLENIDGNLSPACVMVTSHGRVTYNHGNIGNAGLVRLLSATGRNVFTDVHAGQAGYYFAYAGSAGQKIDGAGNMYDPLSESLELYNCSCEDARDQHVIRTHALKKLIIQGGHYRTVKDSHTAVLRVHDASRVGGTAEIADAEFVGYVEFGPLGGGDGGIKYLDVRKVGSDGKPIPNTIDPQRVLRRDLAAAQILSSISVNRCKFSGGDVLVSAGLLGGIMNDCDVTLARGIWGINTPDGGTYMNRPSPRLAVSNTIFRNAKLFKPGTLPYVVFDARCKLIP